MAFQNVTLNPNTMMINRVDIFVYFRGHSPDWYKKVYGHVCANFMKRVRASFKQSTEGPETKV